MNRKETTVSLAIVGIALLATSMSAMIPTQALAIDYGSPDLSYQPSDGFVRDGADSSGTSDNTNEDSVDEEQEEIITDATGNEDDGDKEDSSGSGYETFQDCLAELGQSPTEQEVQDCIESSYGGQDNNELGPSESADEDEEDTNVIQKYNQE
jgi:hypothetical protein